MNTQYQLVTTAEELRRAVDELFIKHAVGLDTETTELDPYLRRLRLIQLASADDVYIIDLNRFADADLKSAPAMDPLRQLLSAPRPIKILHNAKFDANFIKFNLDLTMNRLFATVLARQL